MSVPPKIELMRRLCVRAVLQVRAERKQRVPETEGRVAGDVEAVSAGAQGDSYVLIKKKEKPEEKDDQKQQQQQKQQDQQDQ